MVNKSMYLVIGILIGVIVVLVLVKIPAQPLYAARDAANSAGGESDGVIAFTTIVNKNSPNEPAMLWVLNARKSNLLVYEYVPDNNPTGNAGMIKLTAYRDISNDMEIPAGYSGYKTQPGQSPFEVLSSFEKMRKTMEKQKQDIMDAIKKAESPPK